jgi:hypothetical protein
MENAILPHEVIAILNREKISFVLVGAHGIAGWMNEPRATQDIDIVVSAKHHKKAIRALLAAFPELEEYDLPVVTRLRRSDTTKVAIDVMKTNQQLYRVALKHTRPVQAGGQTYKIPSLEMALAMKFAAMISLYRQDEDKYQDAHDFIRMIKVNADIDQKTLAELGDLVYPGGGQEIVEKVRQVRTGETLKL